MENWKFALSSIRSHKMRSFLTMLGIIIGVAAVVLIMGLGNGMRQSVTDSVTGDKDTVQVYYEAKGEEIDPAYADLSQPTKPVKEVWLEQVARQTPGIDSYFVTNSLTSSISLQKKTVKKKEKKPFVPLNSKALEQKQLMERIHRETNGNPFAKMLFQKIQNDKK